MVRGIYNGIIVTPKGEIKDKMLYFDDKILAIEDDGFMQVEEKIDAGGKYIIPGLVDIHIHGYHGEDISDGSEEGLRIMAKGILENGVSSFLPTTMTVPWDEIVAAFELTKSMMPESQTPKFIGAEILGVHAEGPYVNPKRKGAQADTNILPPDASRMLPYKDIIKKITLAPEMPGGIECIKEITENSDIRVSLGHTDAGYDTIVEAVKAGASHITHLFNAMTGLNHREPGVVGAALTEDVVCELIADCFHIHPGLFSLVYKAKKDKLVLITDCTRAGGLEDGEYTLGGQPIFVKGVECRLADGTIAGSVLRLNHAAKNLYENTDIPLYEAINAASLYPARAIGLDGNKGSLDIGKDADIAIMDASFNIYNTFVIGIEKFSKGSQQ